ncbi:MAG: hypothetical protein IJC20_02855, partial [Clostridia bacterium]|nr:hypothetical protein [Clostridia bacterium]
VLKDPRCMPTVQTILRAEHFYMPQHRSIYAIMVLLDANAQPIDPLVVLEHLKQEGVYDDAAGKTYYEAVIGWDELGSEDKPFEAPVKGDEIGLSISINCGSDTSEFKNIFLRDGGGIIGLNDWTKIPTITLD